MERRDFLRASITGGALSGSAIAAGALTTATAQQPKEVATSRPFAMKFAPHFGMFRHSAGDDPVDQLKYAADHGFAAWEDNGMRGRSADDQNRIAKAMQQLGIEMGVFVAYSGFGKISFTGKDKGLREQAVQDIRDSVEVAKRVNAKWMTVVPGNYDQAVEWDYQTANCVDLLKRCAEVLEPHNLVMVLEPLNWWRDHAGLFLHKIPQAFQICKAVDSPACKILFDIYHQQIEEGNLIPNIDMSWDQVAYFQIGDNPGRCEPGTGEINYGNLFRHIKAKGFDGIMGMEHGNSKPDKAGEQAVIDAYRKTDPMDV